MFFWKAFHLILMHVIHKIQCFEEFLHYFALFFKKKKMIFPEFQPIKIAIINVYESLSVSISAQLVLDQSKHFRPIETVFQSIEIAIKICYESLSVSINAQLVLDQSKHFRPIESNFQSVENRIKSFLKTKFLMCSYTFSKFFKLFLSLFHWSKAPSKIFVIFLQTYCKVLLLQRRLDSCAPSF